MEIKTFKKELDFSSTQGYFLSHVNGGGVLGKTLLQCIDFYQGHFFIFLPEKVNIERLYSFSEGEINPVTSAQETYYIQEISDSISQMRITTDREVSRFIKEYLKIDDDHFAICEDVMQTPADPHVDIPNVTSHFYENVVYYILSNDNSTQEICETLGRTNYIWYSLVVLTSGKKPLQWLEATDFSSICEHTRYILTSAHDGENYIVWQRDVE